MDRLRDVSANNVELRQRLEQQSREIASLEDSGKAQQKLLQEFERRAEAQVRKDQSSREAETKSKLEEAKAEGLREREELLGRIQKLEEERVLSDAQRDAAQTQVSELEAKLEAAELGPEQHQVRLRALEMELSLVRSRFAREAAAREIATKAAFQTQAALDKATTELDILKRVMDERQEFYSFRHEVNSDVQAKLHAEKTEAERQLILERGKRQAVARLENVLPRNVLLKALG